MVSLDELAIIIPLVMSVAVPLIVIGLTRYLSGSDRMSRNSSLATFSINDLQKDLASTQENTDKIIREMKTDIRDIWKRIETTDRTTYNISWRLDNDICKRLDKIEKGNHNG